MKQIETNFEFGKLTVSTALVLKRIPVIEAQNPT